MTAYYIAQHEITDPAAFADYLEQTIPFIEKHGGRYLTKAGTHDMLEGKRPTRVVIAEFPDKAAIKAWDKNRCEQVARSVMIAIEGA